MLRHKILVLLLIAGVGWGGYHYTSRDTEAATVRYTTSIAEVGTVTSSVSGTGQIGVTEKTDVTPETSGKLVALYVKEGDAIEKGTLIASLDARDAVRAVSDAEISLAQAQEDLEELLSGADSQDITSAENALFRAQRALSDAKKEYEDINDTINEEIDDTYSDAYDEISSAFLTLSNYMEDLQDVMGNGGNDENIAGYKLILGSNSAFIAAFTNAYDDAEDVYNDAFLSFRGVRRTADHMTLYELIAETERAAEVVSEALESARHMFDAISVTDYNSKLNIASTINSMRPKIESDVTASFSVTNSLRNARDDIDDLVDGRSDRIIDAELAYKSALEDEEAARIKLEDLRAGAIDLEVRSQRNTVAQRERSLQSARETLGDHSVRAPFTGVVTDIAVEIGDAVSSGTKIVTLSAMQQIATISLNEVDIAAVRLGQPATLVFDAVEGLSLSGTVTEIDDIATTTQGVVTYGVTVTLDIVSNRIKQGMTTDVTIVTDVRTDVVHVPNAAVRMQGDQQYVELMENGTPVRRNVTAGLSSDERTEIIDGLSEGESVVTATIDTSAASAAPATSAGGGFRGGAAGGGFSAPSGGFRGF